MILPSIKYIKERFDRHICRCTDSFSEYFEEEFDAFTEVAEEPLACSVSYIKNPAFASEKEVRIIYQTNISGDYKEEDMIDACRRKQDIGHKGQFVLSPLEYQFRNNNLISYADLSFENLIKDGIVHEVIIGPKSNICEEDLKHYLLINGYGTDVVIRKSKASYR